MKKRNLIIILVVAVLGVAALIVAGHGSKNTTFIDDYHVDGIQDVTKIFLADKQDHTVLLTKGYEDNDTAWTINGQYEANQSMVEMLLETLNQMRVRQQVNKAAVPNAIKNIGASSVKCEVYKNEPFINWFGGAIQLFRREKLVVTYFVGHETQDNMGNYIYREGDKVPYIVHVPGFRGFIAPRFVTDPVLWRSHRIVNMNVKEIKQVSLDITDKPEESFSILSNGTGGFSMQMAQSNVVVPYYDTARVAQMLLSFSNLNFDEFANKVPKAELDSAFRRPPSTVLTVTDTANRQYKVKTYIKYKNLDDVEKVGGEELYEVFDLNRMYAIINDKDTVLIQYLSFDNILQPASFFLGKEVNPLVQ